MNTTISILFGTLFDRDFVCDAAKRVGAVQRVKMLHPYDVLLALLRCALGDEERSVATARREFQSLTGDMPEESSFYERLTPGMIATAWILFLRALAKTNRHQRRDIARALGLPVRDVRAVDGSSVTLPDRASRHFPSTDSRHGGFKLTVTLSLVEQMLTAVHFTDARQHDRKAFDLPKVVRNVLWLMDRGYSDHSLFAQIADGKGFFLVRLKSSSTPTVEQIRAGLAPEHQGKRLERSLPFEGIVDVDARFSVGRTGSRVFRVVGIPVDKTSNGKPGYVWLATNLPNRVDAQAVGATYRLRWSIESLFKVLKTVGRLDQIQSGKPPIIQVFVGVTLLGLVLSQAICAAMRTTRPGCQPSLHRVFALLLSNLPRIIASAGTAASDQALQAFVNALWKEGVNPNPGRSYARDRHLSSVVN